MYLTDHGLVSGNHCDLKLVNALELGALGGGCAGHPTQLWELEEEVLITNGGKSDSLVLDWEVLLGLNSLVKAITPPPPLHNTASELINDQHLLAPDNVVNIPQEKLLGLYCV